MSRQAWREFLCSPERASRHLSNIGRNVIGGVGDAIDLAELRSFLERLNKTNDIRLLGTSVDLISGEYLHFLENTLPGLLDSLSNEMLAQEQVVGPGLRGNPLWDRTISQRISGQLRPAHFVSRTAHRSFDLPENRAIAWLVANLGEAVSVVEKRTGTIAMHASLERIRAACVLAERHHWFGDIQAPTVLTSEMTRAVKRHRQIGYRLAAKLIERRRELSARPGDAWWYAILALLAVNWLEPINDDDLFELFVLALTIEIISVDLAFGDPIEFGLVAAHRGHIALFQKDGVSIRVFFDQSPTSAIGAPDEYTGVVRDHFGVTGNARRPDILVVADNGTSQQTAFLEVKRSTDGRYISDSIYKCFGYLFDYRALVTEGSLSGLLVVPEGITPAAAHSASKELQLVSGNDRNSFRNALEAAVLATE